MTLTVCLIFDHVSYFMKLLKCIESLIKNIHIINSSFSCFGVAAAKSVVDWPEKRRVVV